MDNFQSNFQVMTKGKNIELNPRDEIVLRAVIDNFITSSRAVSSQSIKSNFGLDVSPATIRNIMARLETYGLLSHQYTSAGRLPTDAGYRYYVDKLIHDVDIIPGLREKIENNLVFSDPSVDGMMRTIAGLLGKMSRLFGVVLVNQIQKSLLKNIEIAHLSSDRALLVLTMESGFLRSVVMNISCELTETDRVKVIQLLNERLTGLTLREIQKTFESRLKDSELYGHELVQILLGNPDDYFSIPVTQQVFLSPIDNLLMNPEFNDITTVQKTLVALESRNLKVLLNKYSGLPINTAIGTEIQDRHLEHCSVMISGFFGTNLRGKLAIIGPKRQPYPYIKKLLDTVSEIIPDVC